MRRRKMVDIMIFMEFQYALKTQPLKEIHNNSYVFSMIAKTIWCCDEVWFLGVSIVTRRDL